MIADSRSGCATFSAIVIHSTSPRSWWMKAIGSASVPGWASLPSNTISTGVGFVDPGEYFDQRRLARPVLPEQRVNLAAANVKVDVIERERPGEALDEPASSRAATPARRPNGPASTRFTGDHSGQFDRLAGRDNPRGRSRRGLRKATSRPRFRDSAAYSCCWG